MPGEGTAAALVWCPFPDPDYARAAAARLLDEGLIACANIIGMVESHFIWEGSPSSSTETGVVFKTTADLLPVVVERLGELHPYDIPVIVGWRCDAGLPATLAWLATSCPDPARSGHVPDGPEPDLTAG